jgi:hypothetical protein|tara:strand:- start:512 stop:1117 length:606 start_codon:yes stop_codon:yes gene_type:complete
MSLKQKTQNGLLMENLMEFYKNKEHLKFMMNVISGETNISLRIVDWFVTNYSKKNYTVYDIQNPQYIDRMTRFKVYNDYKLKLKAYSKRRFDPFCRWERIKISYDENNYMETTIGQLNFFKWAIENKIIDYIQQHYDDIEKDMNDRNSISKKKGSLTNHEESSIVLQKDNGKTRKKREELSISACKCIKKENVKIVVSFNE